MNQYGETPPLTMEQRQMKARISNDQVALIEWARNFETGNCWLELVQVDGSTSGAYFHWREFSAGGQTVHRTVRIPMTQREARKDETFDYQPIVTMNADDGVVLGRMKE